MKLWVLPARSYASTRSSYGPVSVCLCLSVTSRSCVKTAGRIELVFGMEASFHQCYTVFKGNSGISKNNGRLVPSGTSSQTPDLDYFAFVYNIYRRNVLSIDLAGERWTLRAWQTGLSSVNWVDNTSELRRSSASLSQWSSSSVCSTIASRGRVN